MKCVSKCNIHNDRLKQFTLLRYDYKTYKRKEKIIHFNIKQVRVISLLDESVESQFYCILFVVAVVLSQLNLYFIFIRMSCKLVSFLAIFILVASHHSHGHTYHSGECPTVEPMSGFDMRQVRFSFC